MHEGEFYQRPALPHTGDEACDFCEVIVQHWREILTSNTTETEFKQVGEADMERMIAFEETMTCSSCSLLPDVHGVVSEMWTKC